MSVEVVMPKMGESIQEGKVLRWVKNVGDKVERDETLLEISTDKVDTEVPSPVAGTILQILAAENDTVEVGSVIAIIGADNEVPSAAPAQAAPAQAAPAQAAPAQAAPAQAAPAQAAPAPTAQAAPAAAPATQAPASGGSDVEVVMPKMGESIQEGKVLRWVKKVGDKVERDETLLEISTDKVDTEVPSPVAGTLSAILANEGDVVEVGNVIARISTGAAAPQAAAPQAAAPQAAAPQAPTPAPVAPAAVAPASNGTHKTEVPAGVATAATSSIPRTSGSRFYSPLVRSIAAAEGLNVANLDAIQGTGLEGRVTKTDMMAYLQGSRPTAARPSAAQAAQTPAAPSAPGAAPSQTTVPATPQAAVTAPATQTGSGISIGADDEIIPMDRIRQLIAEHMVRSKQTSPHVTSVAEADVTGMVKMREKSKDEFQKREGFKLTYNPFFGVAAAEAIKQWPRINVSVDGKNIIQHRRVHLGMAAALPDGNLIVPVIKNADMLNVTGMARAMNDLGQRAKTKKLTPDDISGGTLTITNVGSFGSLFGTPVINQPQTAIIGIGAIQKRPVVKEVDGEDLVVVRSMVYLSITYDHRVIDGALATQALAAMVRALEGMNATTVAL